MLEAALSPEWYGSDPCKSAVLFCDVQSVSGALSLKEIALPIGGPAGPVASWPI